MHLIELSAECPIDIKNSFVVVMTKAQKEVALDSL